MPLRVRLSEGLGPALSARVEPNSPVAACMKADASIRILPNLRIALRLNGCALARNYGGLGCL